MGSRLRLHPQWLALLILLVLVLWMASGGPPVSSRHEAPARAPVTEAGRMRVKVLESIARPIAREVQVQGQVEPLRSVLLKAQTSGQVVDLPVARGQRVKAGELLVQLSAEERPARLAQAEAQLRQAQHALNAAQALQRQALQSESRLLELEAELAAAEAARESARLELAHTRIAAPFDAILDLRPVEQGDFVDRADPVATLVDVQTLLVTGQVPQQRLGELRLGQPAQVRLLDERTLPGTLGYIATRGEAGTRSYRVEVRVPNPGWERLSGHSATLRLPVAEVMAHFVSPSLLSLDQTGQLEIKAVDAQQRVRSLPVQVVKADATGVWLQGLPERVRLISLGQGFVTAGERVEPVPEPPR